jgi:hypothetical protein
MKKLLWHLKINLIFCFVISVRKPLQPNLMFVSKGWSLLSCSTMLQVLAKLKHSSLMNWKVCLHLLLFISKTFCTFWRVFLNCQNGKIIWQQLKLEGSLKTWQFKTSDINAVTFLYFLHPSTNVVWIRTLDQGILKGEVSLYHWPPVWLVSINLFCK